MIDRPTSGIPGITTKKKTGCGSIYITDSTLPEFPEVFVRLGKTGTCIRCWCDAIGRLISFVLRIEGDTSLEERRHMIVRALKGIQCPSPIWDDGVQNLSCPDVIAKVLEEKYVKDVLDPAPNSKGGKG